MKSSTPYLDIAKSYYESPAPCKLPQNYKPLGFFCDLYEYALPQEYFLSLRAGNIEKYLARQGVIDQNTNYLLLLSCINEEY